MAYPAMLRFLPAGFLGLMLAGMLAAYRSTIETHLNWGTSYLVHDFYRRFLRPGASERHYVFAGRLVTALLMVCAALLTFALETARESFDLILSIGAGTGLIYLLRWFWWRINAWSEVAAMASSFLVALGFFAARKAGHAVPSYVALVSTVAVTTAVWLATAFFTAPTDRGKLLSFYRLVRPAGPGWKRDPRRGRRGPVAGLALAVPRRLGARMPLRVRGALRRGQRPLRPDGGRGGLDRDLRRERRRARAPAAAALERAARHDGSRRERR